MAIEGDSTSHELTLEERLERIQMALEKLVLMQEEALNLRILDQDIRGKLK